jgi:hypothetical protein
MQTAAKLQKRGFLEFYFKSKPAFEFLMGIVSLLIFGVENYI